FGWAARKEIAREPTRRGRVLAALGIGLGSLFTVVWGGVLTYFLWQHVYPLELAAKAALEPSPTPSPVPNDEPDKPSSPPPLSGATAPKSTTADRVGTTDVVDVGAQAPSLVEELAKQRAEAARTGATLLLMTTKDKCEPCRGVDKSLKDPLMQTALSHVR